MRTVKQISELTGISIRTLHYYDEIGLLKPSKVTESGYRLYDDEALQTLQQILFFKELDFSLKDIRAIMSDPDYNKFNAFAAQKKLIQTKRDRLNRLLDLLDNLLKGEDYMSFKEFDMTDYTNALEDFITNNTGELLKYCGNLDEFQHVLKTLKSDSSKETGLAKMAIAQFGSIEKYTEAMKENMANFPELMEQMSSSKARAKDYIKKSDELMKQLTADLDKDVSCPEVQQIIGELIEDGNSFQPNMNLGENYWSMIADGYLSNSVTIEITDKKYGEGASAFIGNALKAHEKL